MLFVFCLLDHSNSVFKLHSYDCYLLNDELQILKTESNFKYQMYSTNKKLCNMNYYLSSLVIDINSISDLDISHNLLFDV